MLNAQPTELRVFICTELTFDRMTVGKIYAGLLIAENWKAFKANKGAGGNGANSAVVSHTTSDYITVQRNASSLSYNSVDWIYL